MIADRRRRSALRTMGIGGLGLVGGILAGLVLQDILAQSFPDARAVLAVHAALVPLLALAGTVLAVWLDGRVPRRDAQDPGRD